MNPGGRCWARARSPPFTVNTRNATSAGPPLITHAPLFTGFPLPKALCRSWGHRVHNRAQSHTRSSFQRAQSHPHPSILHHLKVQPFPRYPIFTPPLVQLLLKVLFHTSIPPLNYGYPPYLHVLLSSHTPLRFLAPPLWPELYPRERSDPTPPPWSRPRTGPAP